MAVDRAHSDICESSTTGGTGNQVLAGAFDASYRTFSSKYGNGDKGFCILKQGTDRELCEFTYNSGANSITRSAVIWSTNSNNLVNFSAGQIIQIFDTLPGPSDLSTSQRARLAFVLGVASFVDGQTLTTGQQQQILGNIGALGWVPQTISASLQAQARGNISAPLKGHLYDLTLSNNGTDATNDIDIAAGEAASSETNPILMIFGGMTKRLDASWAAGTNQGMRYSGASIANATYGIFLGTKANGADADIYAYPGVDEATALTALQAETGGSSYVSIRRIGCILRESAAIVAFIQRGDKFLRATSTEAINATFGAGAFNAGVLVPSGLKLDVILRGSMTNSGSGYAALISCPDEGTPTPSGSGPHNFRGGAGQISANEITVRTNTSAQVRVATNAAGTVAYFHSVGWIDTRGRLVA